MQSLRNLHLRFSGCVLATITVLGAAALTSKASEQMAAKRHISLQFRQDMQRCEPLRGDAVHLCERHAHGSAEIAKADLETRREGLSQGRPARAAHAHKMAQARCNALSGRVRQRCAGSAG